MTVTVSSVIDDDLNRRLTNWQLRTRHGSRSEAVRLLLQDALAAEEGISHEEKQRDADIDTLLSDARTLVDSPVEYSVTGQRSGD